jgi:hypothetical protein
MNIVIVGGGTPGHFGNDFVNRAKLEGHAVRVLSHRTSKDTNERINFLDVEGAVSKFKCVTEDFNKIDILLYNSVYKGIPDSDVHFTSKGTFSEKLYVYGFYVNVIVPHRLSVEALKKMDNNSKILFMTTDVIYDREREENLCKLSYYGGKAYQHQLMLALADCNDKSATVSSISPYFNYEDKAEYKKAFEEVYAHIFSKTKNGKVFDCWNSYA